MKNLPTASAKAMQAVHQHSSGKPATTAQILQVKWQGLTYGKPDEGLFVACPNPWNPKRMLLLVLSNSRTQQWAMTKAVPRGIPGWAVYRGSEVQRTGPALAEGTVLTFKP